MRLFLSLLFLLPTLAFSQAIPDISGVWEGDLYQNEDGFADRFDLVLQVRQNGIFINGTAYVSLGDIQAEMKFSGAREMNGSWKIQETEILRSQQPENILWCFKGYELRLGYSPNGLTLTGPWWGNTVESVCVPGSVLLRKKVKGV